MRRPWMYAGVTLLALELLIGCSSVNPIPFQEFSTSAQGIRASADKVLETDYGMARERMVNNAKTDPGTAIKQLKIDRVVGAQGRVKDFEWRTTDEPLFLTIRRYRRGVHDFNSVLVTYAQGLANLAGPVTLTNEQVTEMASNLTTNAAEAARGLNIGVNQKKLAIFSTVAVGAFQQYLVSKQRSDLRKALVENQEWIVEVSRLGEEATKNMAAALWQEFLALQGDINVKIATAGASARPQDIKQKIALNEKFVDLLEALKTLDDAYAKIPIAHAELSDSLRVDHFNMESIRELSALGKRLERLYQQLKKEDSAGS
jgi:uncharacterized membrane protein